VALKNNHYNWWLA